MTRTTSWTPNHPTGSDGLVAVDKVGNKVLFLHPETLETMTAVEGFACRVHELAISPDRTRAYVPIYGNGRHGANPEPGSSIAVLDLAARRHVADISVSPFLAPHGLRWGATGQLYCTCEDSGVVLEIEPSSGDIRHVIEVGSHNAHRLEVLPDGSKLYTENEEDSFASVIDLRTRRRLRDIPSPGGLAGLGLSPDGRILVLVDAARPELAIVDTGSDAVVRRIRLARHHGAAQIARFSPDGSFLVVTNHDEGIGTVLDASLDKQRQITLGKEPMDMAFSLDGTTVLIGNQGDGTITVVDLQSGDVLRTVQAGEGVETLAFF